MPFNKIRDFLQWEAAGGILLLLSAVLALVLNNSPLAAGYQALLTTPFSIQLLQGPFDNDLIFWINEGLMVFFFLLVGLELKREFIAGHLSKAKDVVLPGAAALGGMVVPALLFIFINFNHPVGLKAWAVPVATDIAFALGALSLFGKKVPIGLKLFLMALAIFDDIGAILIIACSHTNHFSLTFLLLAVGCVLVLLCLNRLGVQRLLPYLVLGILLWFCVLKSGIHATIAGVVLAGLIPINKKNIRQSPLHYLEGALQPWVVYGVLPLFALANAGVSFQGLGWNNLFDPILLGIMAGLIIGKPIGVLAFSGFMIRMKWARLPSGTAWPEMVGVALLCGIGFTMSLFLGTLAFQREAANYLLEVRLGVLLGSLISGLLGMVVLQRAFKRPDHSSRPNNA